MFLPIGTDRPRTRPTRITYWLMSAMVGVYALQVLAGRAQPEFAESIIAFGVLDDQSRVWTLVTYQFLHGSLMHLLGNLLFLWVFGPPVEDRITRTGFAGFFLIGGAVAGLIHNLLDGTPVIGASGAISAVTGAFLVLFPRTHIKLLIFFFIIGVFSIPAWWFIAFAIARDLFFQGLGSDGVAHLAHLGGYLYGGGVSVALLGLGVIPREPAWDLLSIGRQAHRRRVFKELASRGSSPWRSDQAAPSRPVRAERDDPHAVRISGLRGEISEAIAQGDNARAMRMYESLLEEQPDATLGRESQLLLANLLFGEGRHQTAARAYELYEQRFPHDAEANRVRLMRALILGRYLNDPVGAAKILQEMDQTRLDASHRDLARALSAELG